MFKKSAFGIVFNSLLSFAFAGVLTLFIQFMNGGLTFEHFAQGLFQPMPSISSLAHTFRW